LQVQVHFSALFLSFFFYSEFTALAFTGLGWREAYCARLGPQAGQTGFLFIHVHLNWI
jgi:hypothetical protein